MEPAKIEAAQREYDRMCDGPIPLLPDWIAAKTDDEAWALIQEAVGDMPVEYGSMKRALTELADEYVNWPKPSQAFYARAAAFMWMVMSQMDTMRESEQ